MCVSVHVRLGVCVCVCAYVYVCVCCVCACMRACVYQSPSNPMSIGLDDLGQLLSKLMLVSHYVVLAGDLNIDMLSTCAATTLLLIIKICLIILIWFNMLPVHLG